MNRKLSIALHVLAVVGPIWWLAPVGLIHTPLDPYRLGWKGPLTADGLPDVSHAPSERPKVPAERNAWARLFETVDFPAEYSWGQDRAETCRKLGVNADPSAKAVLLEPEAWRASPNLLVSPDQRDSIIFEWDQQQFEDAYCQPWTAAGHPQVDLYLRSHHKALERLRAAAEAPEAWWPWAYTVNLPTDRICQLLRLQCNRCLGDARFEEALAWTRVQHRWIRFAHECGSPFPLDMGLTDDATTFACALNAAAAHSPVWPVLRTWADEPDIPPALDPERQLDAWNRLWFWNLMFRPREGCDGLPLRESPWGFHMDDNAILEAAEELHATHHDYRADRREARRRTPLLLWVPPGWRRVATGRTVGLELAFGRHSQEISNYVVAQRLSAIVARTHAKSVRQIVWRVERYRADHGRYPAHFSDLGPDASPLWQGRVDGQDYAMQYEATADGQDWRLFIPAGGKNFPCHFVRFHATKR